MLKKIIITNNNSLRAKIPNDFIMQYESYGVSLYTQNNCFHVANDLCIFLDGYIIPRYESFSQVEKYDSYDLIKTLYERFGDSFINHIKGIFCIVLISNGELKVFTDYYGAYKLFYSSKSGDFIFTNSFSLLTRLIGSVGLNHTSIATKSILNHEINGNTVFENIEFTKPSTLITIKGSKIVSLTSSNFDTLLTIEPRENKYDYFADLLHNLIDQYNKYLSPNKSIVTITGGKDSRTILSALLSNNLSPIGLTYGSIDSRDVIYAKEVAKTANLIYYNIDPEKNVDQFEENSLAIIKMGNPLINIHRAHRYYAFHKMQEIVGENTAFYSGYMGGELLMGIFYDDLIFTNFVTDSWENGIHRVNQIKSTLSSKFIRINDSLIEEVFSQLQKLNTFNESVSLFEKQFYGLFEIGIPHHCQDLFLAQHCFKYPIPFFLDIDFINELFGSYHSFKYRNNKTKNLLKRYSLYEFNLNIQHILYPLLDSVSFAKKGSYNTREFLKGPLYWTIIKSYRYLFEKKNYPPSFSYNVEYMKFILKWLNEIILDRTSVIHQVYNVEEALRTISKSLVYKTERELLPYSMIVMHYLQLKQLCNV